VEHLSNTDALMWFVEEDPLLRSTIVGVFVLDSTPDWGKVNHRIERVTHQLPMLRHRIVVSAVNPGHLRWEPVEDLDLGYHLRHIQLPEGAGIDDVLEFARTTAAAGFDKSRPLWEYNVLDGLEGGRAALVTKMHHVLTDGVGSIQIAARVFDFEPHPAPRPEVEPFLPHPTPLDPVSRFVGDLLEEFDTTTQLVAHQFTTTLPNLVKASFNPAKLLRDSVEVVKSVGRTVAPTLTTYSPIMTARGRTNSFHVLDLPLADLRHAAHAAHGTLNDAFLAGITGGIRRYHEHHGVSTELLRVAMPISLREDDHAEGGNHVTVLRFTVPAPIVDAAERIRAMGEVAHRQREEASLPFTDRLAGVLNLLPTSLIGAMMKHVDFLASNVPGTPIPMYLEGAKVEQFFPFGPTAGAAVNVTLMSYCGRVCIGLNCDRQAIPDVEEFMRCMTEGFDEVLALAD